MRLFGLEITWPSKVIACKYNPPWTSDLTRGPHCDPYIAHSYADADFPT